MSHPLLERLRSPDPDERCAACREIAEDPAAVLLIEGLAGALGDPVKAVARAATETLVKLGRDHDVQPTLRRALRDDDPLRRVDAALALAR
ncbi:MAG: HEAT repeat domain-containing protein, partial [Myxococcota bacterium]